MDGSTAFLMSAAFAAGCIDSIVGGGGLIQLPALLAGLPNALPPFLLGTNKFASLMGTGSATLRYARAVTLSWKTLVPAAAIAFIASLLGSVTVAHVSPNLFRPMVPIVLVLVLIYTLLRKDLGHSHIPRDLTWIAAGVGLMLIALVGFYDGFFGPGAGSFLMLLFIRFYGFDFINAAASARLVNCATNAASLLWFGSHGQVFWVLGALMAAANVTGAQVGTRLAIRQGAAFVRILFILIVLVLIVKTGRDALSMLPRG
jgi:hypothetical protein